MRDVLILSNLEQIKSISQAYRIDILDAFQNKPATAKMISERLGEPHAKVNYHIKELRKHGVVDLVEEVVKLGIVEKYYLPVAKNFVVDSQSIKFGDKDSELSYNQYWITLFESMSSAFYESVSHKASRDLKLRLDNDLHLTPRQVEQLNDDIVALIGKYRNVTPADSDVHQYTFGSLIIPKINGD